MLSTVSVSNYNQTRNQNIWFILRLIAKHKTTLFGQNNHYLIGVRAAKWQEIYERAVKLEVAPAHKNWKYMRDIIWQKWKAKTLAKINIIDAEHSKVSVLRSLTKCELLILEILGLKIQMPTIKVEDNSEPEDEGFEILSDNDIALQSATVSSNHIKPTNITFIPVVQKSIQPEVDKKTPSEINDVNNKKRRISNSENISSSSIKSDENKNLNEDQPPTAKKPNLENDIKNEENSKDSVLQFPSDIKNIHKMILENVRDIKMKLLIQKKSNHCESCCSANKEMLSVQNQILKVQEGNFKIQLKMLDELKKISSAKTNDFSKNEKQLENLNKDNENSNSSCKSNGDEKEINRKIIR